ncbi:ABC transporter ATP-binding protein [Prosthecomicrobium sp. N25]|uniref:ABC transporter ATP-binding protein n=1 Tax=Prosthecomicrobium sp. N25 TaxID=3129254 RepID=UPI003077250B
MTAPVVPHLRTEDGQIARALLVVEGLTTSFPTRGGVVTAVDGLDLTVNEGECLGVVGESGSGKSVTFLSVLGLVRPPGTVTARRLSFAGRDLLALSEEARRDLRGREIAITMQDALTALNPAFTVATQITETLLAHGRAASMAEARRAAVEIMGLVGIPAPGKRLDDYPHQFSGGMRQRIMIAIALACRPRLLIADEPTTALDVTIQAQVLDLIADLRRDLGMSVVLITHDLGVVAEHSDRVLVMYAGQVVEAGRTRDVIDRPLHPYTRGLLASMPSLEDLDRPIQPIPGQVPDPTRLPAHCRFFDRCGLADEACRTPVPLAPAGPGRAVRCVRPGEPVDA